MHKDAKLEFDLLLGMKQHKLVPINDWVPSATDILNNETHLETYIKKFPDKFSKTAHTIEGIVAPGMK